METFDSLIFRDITSSKIAIGNTKDTINKFFVFDFTSSIKISSKFTPKDDLIQLGLVLLELNGVKFVPRTDADDNYDDTNAIIESLLKEWDKAYVKVRLNFSRFLCKFIHLVTIFIDFLGIVR